MGLCWGSIIAWAQIIGAGYRSPDTKICRAQYSSKPFPEQNAFSNENDRKDTLPQHGGVPHLRAKLTSRPLNCSPRL